MDETIDQSKPKHHPILMRFYDWVEQWVDRFPSSDRDKNHQVICKTGEEKRDDIDYSF